MKYKLSKAIRLQQDLIKERPHDERLKTMLGLLIGISNDYNNVVTMLEGTAND